MKGMVDRIRNVISSPIDGSSVEISIWRRLETPVRNAIRFPVRASVWASVWGWAGLPVGSGEWFVLRKKAKKEIMM